MKKILFVVALISSFSASAFWNNNNGPWNNNWGGNNFNPWMMEDNGIFGFNPYEWTDPEWYPQEMENFVDEFSGNSWNNGWGNNNNYYNPYYNPYMRGNFNPNFNPNSNGFNPYMGGGFNTQNTNPQNK